MERKLTRLMCSLHSSEEAVVGRDESPELLGQY